MKTRTFRSVDRSMYPAKRLANSLLPFPRLACPLLALWMLAAQGFAAPGFAAPAMARQAADAPAAHDPGSRQDQRNEAPQEEVLEIEWRTDIAVAKAEAKKAGKPILYYFRCDP